jgi:hypothetical protein
MDGPPIKFWKINPNGSPKLFIKILNLVPYCPILGHDALRSMEREKFISVELSKCMEFWKQSIEQNATYKMKMIPYVEYWENILLHLSKSLFF